MNKTIKLIHVGFWYITYDKGEQIHKLNSYIFTECYYTVIKMYSFISKNMFLITFSSISIFITL